MKRRSFKYLFLFFCVLLSVSVITIIAANYKDEKSSVATAITTPLVNSETVNTSFCKNASSAIIIDAKSGAVLFEKQAHKKLPMASTTKIMTALCVIEKSNPDDIITVSQQAVGIEGSSIYLKKGEKISVRDLLYGLLLESGNDAGVALAVGVFGSEKACVEYMNQTAHSMGLVSTSFDNVHGLDSENHYTTAYELALITKYAMKNELFRSIVGSKSYVTAGENPRYFSNHNRLLRMTDTAIGVKTGYTSKAGRCLVSCASKDNEEYIAVTLCDQYDWQDHKQMHEFAIENYRSIEIADSENFKIRAGFDDYIIKDDIYLTTFGQKEFCINYRIKLENGIGTVEYSTDNAPLGSFGITRQADAVE